MGPGGTRVGPGGTRMDPVDPVGLTKTQMGLDGKTWEPDDPVLYSVPCLVMLLIFVATVKNMEAQK